MSGLANMYDLKDEAQAKEYLEKLGIEYRFQCYHEKLPDGCHRLADVLEAFQQEYKKARGVYRTNCDESKYGKSCFKFGNYCMVGRGGKEDKGLARQYFEKGCNYNDGRSCHNAALLDIIGEDGKEQKKCFKSAEKFLQKGCDLDNVPSCHLLSTIYITGKDGVPKDMKKAYDLAKKSCDKGHMYSCANLSVMYRKGDGVKADPEMAEKYKKKAQEMFKGVTDPDGGIEFGKTKKKIS